MTVASRGFLLDATLLSRPVFYVLPILGLSAFQIIVVIMVTNVWRCLYRPPEWEPSAPLTFGS